ncbi:hypothetical protein LV84_03217 [Algoriphagus ratkowskyi]|nr:hypothetical protein LV84_03217 [Algoriphagus ratkowskyi]
MEGVRIWHDPKTSLLNEYNQLNACKNVFVTESASMTSTSSQNPILTFMALTARAATYVVEKLNGLILGVKSEGKEIIELENRE